MCVETTIACLIFCETLGAKLGRVSLKTAHLLYQQMLKHSPELARHPRCRNAAIDMSVDGIFILYDRIDSGLGLANVQICKQHTKFSKLIKS